MLDVPTCEKQQERGRFFLGIGDATDEMDAVIAARHLGKDLGEDLVLLEEAIVDLLADTHHIAVLSLSRADHQRADSGVSGLSLRQSNLLFMPAEQRCLHSVGLQLVVEAVLVGLQRVQEGHLGFLHGVLLIVSTNANCFQQHQTRLSSLLLFRHFTFAVLLEVRGPQIRLPVKDKRHGMSEVNVNLGCVNAKEKSGRIQKTVGIMLEVTFTTILHFAVYL